MSPTSPLLRVLAGETVRPPPIWLMRQAGRTLPEYRALRAEAADFIAFCLDPERAAEATLQPVRRFGFDAAIVFADILLVPEALGQTVGFEAGEGPRLGPMPPLAALAEAIDQIEARLAPVGETIARARRALAQDKALIGFSGGPWTVATYMIQGRGGDRAQARARLFEPGEDLDALLAVLADASARYLALQARAGAQALQIFESWAELLAEDQFERVVIRPHRRILAQLRAAGVDLPVIGFPRGAGALALDYGRATPVQSVGLDVQAPAWLGRRLQRRMAIQGALDPLLLRAGGPALDAAVERLVGQWGAGPYIFNLGHGLLPDTPLDNIARLIERVRR